MSFNRLNYDDCTYKHDLKQSVGPGDYMLNKPTIECKACFPKDPQVNVQLKGAAECSLYEARIDVSSDLLGITRKASNCPTRKFMPPGEKACETIPLKDCISLPNEDTRISNPPCTLRSTGWNRWEWLCQNPQEKALIPFDYNISNRIVVKDNHRPCLPTPISQLPILPRNHMDVDVQQQPQYCRQPSSDIPSIHWRSCGTYAPYGF
jgi:hypothetical protein